MWILYLLGCTLITLGPAWALGTPSYESYRPAAAMLMVLCGVGVSVLWPMVRLSQAAPRHTVRAVTADLLVLLLPLAAVVLPQAFPFMTGWPFSVTSAIMLVLVGWALGIGGVLAAVLSTAQPSGALRTWVMVAISIATLAAPATTLTRPRTPPPPRVRDVVYGAMLASPLTAPWEIARDRSWSGQAARVLPIHDTAVRWTLAGGGLLFCSGLVVAVARRRTAA